VSDKAQVNFTVDTDAKELAKQKLNHGELSAQLRKTIQQIAFGEEISERETTKRHLAELREKKDELRAQKRDIESELEDIEQKITRAEEQLDNMERKEDKYEGSLEMLEEGLRDGMRVDVKHGQVMKAAKLGGKEPEGVIKDLQERNPEVPEYAYQQKMYDSHEWRGVSSSSSSSSIE